MDLRSVDERGASWFLLEVNPEPWTVGTLGVGRRGKGVFPTVSKDAGVMAYQESIKEELAGLRFDYESLGPIKVTFYFWRNLATYRTPSGKMHTKHIADATNMQKATEDALQGILFGNDRENREVRSVVVDQGPKVKGKVVVEIMPYDEEMWEYELPANLLQRIYEIDSADGVPLPEAVYDDGDPF